jgi:hypothetical protein
MGQDMSMVLGGRLLPKPSTFKKTDSINGVDVTTLGGVLYTDFRDRRRSWDVGWENILYATDHETIMDIWREQITTRTYPMLQFDAESIYVPVKIDISSQSLKYNGTLVQSFTITLTEANPIS